MTNWKEYKIGNLVAIKNRSIGCNFEFKAIEYIDTSSVTENNFDAPTYTGISEKSTGYFEKPIALQQRIKTHLVKVGI